MKWWAIFCGIIVISIMGLFTVIYVVYVGSGFTRTITVKEKWVKRSGTETDKYLFSDTDENVYEITDTILLWRFDASDRWTKIEEGGTYKITFYGWRNHFLSWYQNAVEIEEVM